MRVSEFYSLGVSQPSLDFLDVDVEKDTRVFVDPFAFSYLQSDWGRECVSLLQDFYTEVLDAIRSGHRKRALSLLAMLGESNEAHLGLSSDASHGSGVSDGLALEIFEALSTSRAVASGLLTDVHETVLFVEGIGHDRISDMTIAIVRRQLIEYTQRMCDLNGIPMVWGLDSGPMWNRQTHKWDAEHVDLPMPNGKLLLIPKAIVRKTSTFDAGDYLRHFVLPYLQEQELQDSSSTIVQERRSKSRRGVKFVTKKDIVARDGKATKEWNTDVTDQYPELLDKYRAEKARATEPPDHDAIAAATETDGPDWDGLLEAVRSVPPGRAGADDYHRAVQHLLTALLYPALDMPVREFKRNEGRKRIDIVFTNLAETGFFHWLHNAGGVPAGLVVIECKNYSAPLSNPEFDQLTGRFSPLKGQFGLLCYRGFADDKASVVRHCRDAALDRRGFVIALDDDDLVELVQSRKDGELTLFKHLMDRFQELI